MSKVVSRDKDQTDRMQMPTRGLLLCTPKKLGSETLDSSQKTPSSYQVSKLKQRRGIGGTMSSFGLSPDPARWTGKLANHA